MPTSAPSRTIGSWCTPFATMSSRAALRSASGASVLSGMRVITSPTGVVAHASCGEVLGVGDAHDTEQSPAVDNGQRALAVPQRVLEHEVMHAERRFRHSWRRIHYGGDWHPIQDVAHGQLLAG